MRIACCEYAPELSGAYVPQVGDRVRCMHAGPSPLKAGDEYYVTQTVADYETGELLVYLEGSRIGWLAWRFEIVERALP